MNNYHVILAYDTYRDYIYLGNMDKDRKYLPPFDELPSHERSAWVSCINTVINSTKNNNEILPAPPGPRSVKGRSTS